MAEPMLEMVGVTAGYGRSMVLFDVDLSIPNGGAAAVMGHNGAGKTTLLRVAVGLIPVKSGKVLLDGEDVTKMRPNRRVRNGPRLRPAGPALLPADDHDGEPPAGLDREVRDRRGARHVPRAHRPVEPAGGPAVGWSTPTARHRPDAARPSRGC